MNRDNLNIIQSNASLAIGKRIQMEVLQYERAEYGRGILATLSQELSAELGRDYSYSALTLMVEFHEVAPDEEIVAALRRQSGWTNFRALIPIRRQSPIWFTRIRTTESSDNRPISRPESSDQALESSILIPSIIKGASSAEQQCGIIGVQPARGHSLCRHHSPQMEGIRGQRDE